MTMKVFPPAGTVTMKTTREDPCERLSKRRRSPVPPLHLCLALFLAACVPASRVMARQSMPTVIPNAVLLRIVRAEDERRWDVDLQTLLTDANEGVRRRAALAAGRIG